MNKENLPLNLVIGFTVGQKKSQFVVWQTEQSINSDCFKSALWLSLSMLPFMQFDHMNID